MNSIQVYLLGDSAVRQTVTEIAIIKSNSVIYYLYADTTATRSITETEQGHKKYKNTIRRITVDP
jgi:hypothetical protein